MHIYIYICAYTRQLFLWSPRQAFVTPTRCEVVCRARTKLILT